MIDLLKHRCESHNFLDSFSPLPHLESLLGLNASLHTRHVNYLTSTTSNSRPEKAHCTCHCPDTMRWDISFQLYHLQGRNQGTGLSIFCESSNHSRAARYPLSFRIDRSRSKDTLNPSRFRTTMDSSTRDSLFIHLKDSFCRHSNESHSRQVLSCFTSSHVWHSTSSILSGTCNRMEVKPDPFAAHLSNKSDIICLQNYRACVSRHQSLL